jgi:hypothetical protein
MGMLKHGTEEGEGLRVIVALAGEVSISLQPTFAVPPDH